jgi:hypothetical protein
MPPLVRPGQTQWAAVLDYSRALPERDRCGGPPFAAGAKSGQCDVIVFNAGNMPNDTHRLTAMIEFLVAHPEVAKHPKIAKLLQ